MTSTLDGRSSRQRHRRDALAATRGASRRRHRRDRVKFNEDAASAPGYSFAAYRIALKTALATGSSILMLTTKWASPWNFDKGTSKVSALEGERHVEELRGGRLRLLCLVAPRPQSRRSGASAASGGAALAPHRRGPATRPAHWPPSSASRCGGQGPGRWQSLQRAQRRLFVQKYWNAMLQTDTSVAKIDLYGDAASFYAVFDTPRHCFCRSSVIS